MSGKVVTIFMADDDPEDLELVQEAIQEVDPTVSFHLFLNAHTFYQQLTACADHELPSLIILDYNMPEMNGAQVLSLLRTNDRFNHIPKVVLSTSNATIHLNECIKNGAIEYLVKPDSLAGMHTLAKKLLSFCVMTNQETGR